MNNALCLSQGIFVCGAQLMWFVHSYVLISMKSNLDYTRGIMPKRVTSAWPSTWATRKRHSGGVPLVTVSDLTVPKIEPKIFSADSDMCSHYAKRPVVYFLLISIFVHFMLLICLSEDCKFSGSKSLLFSIHLIKPLGHGVGFLERQYGYPSTPFTPWKGRHQATTC